MHYELSNNTTVEIAKKYTNNLDDELELIYNLNQVPNFNDYTFIVDKGEYRFVINDSKMRLYIPNTKEENLFMAETYDLEKVYTKKEKFYKFTLPRIGVITSPIIIIFSIIYMFLYGNSPVTAFSWVVAITSSFSILFLVVYGSFQI